MSRNLTKPTHTCTHAVTDNLERTLGLLPILAAPPKASPSFDYQQQQEVNVKFNDLGAIVLRADRE